MAAVAAEEAAAAAAWGGDRRFLQEEAATPGADGSVAALTIPLVGLGTGGLQPGAETSHSVFWALLAGYRLIDTASEVTPNPSHLRLIQLFIHSKERSLAVERERGGLGGDVAMTFSGCYFDGEFVRHRLEIE